MIATRRVLLVVIALLGLAGPLPTLAARRADPGKNLSDKAATLFKEGNFLQAAELFERAFALSPDKLVRLRNAGRAYEEAGRLEYARLVFQRYVQLAPEGPDKAEVRERVSKLDERLKPPEPNPLPKAVPGPPPMARTSQHDVALQKTAPPQRDRTLAWTLTGTGGVAMLGGIGWLVAVGSAQSRMDADVDQKHYDYPGGADKRTRDDSTLTTHRALAWTTLGLGAVALGYGLYDMFRSEPTPLALVPWLAPDEAGLVAAARF